MKTAFFYVLFLYLFSFFFLLLPLFLFVAATATQSPSVAPETPSHLVQIAESDLDQVKG